MFLKIFLIYVIYNEQLVDQINLYLFRNIYIHKEIARVRKHYTYSILLLYNVHSIVKIYANDFK